MHVPCQDGIRFVIMSTMENGLQVRQTLIAEGEKSCRGQMKE